VVLCRWNGEKKVVSAARVEAVVRWQERVLGVREKLTRKERESSKRAQLEPGGE
jgi:hypothetical protein